MKKAANQFISLKAGNALLLRALDLGKKYEFATPSDTAVEAMKKALSAGP